MNDKNGVHRAEETFAAALTPAGRGAIAVVGLRGPRATSAVEACFQSVRRRSVSDAPVGSVLLGIWSAARRELAPSATQAGEELIVTRTGAEEWEIHCHGGQAAVDAVLLSLEQQGCVRIDWQHFVTAKHGAGEHARRAWQDLPRATTERVARILLDQARGALDDAFLEVQQAMAAGESGRTRAISLLDSLLQRAEAGGFLLSPRRIVLAGRPNVGKSSLINALVGFERTLVTPQAGTTRDLVGVLTVIDGWPVELIDTAGVRVTNEPLEASGIARSLDRWQQTDLRILVEDASSESRDTLLADTALPPDLVVWNKIDLSPSMEMSRSVCAVSAVTGQGIQELIHRLAKQLAPVDLSAGVAVPWTEEQRATLRRWRSLV